MSVEVDDGIEESEPYVMVHGDWIRLNQDAVQFSDVHEGMFGEDRCVFRYRGSMYESPITMKRV